MPTNPTAEPKRAAHGWTDDEARAYDVEVALELLLEAARREGTITKVELDVATGEAVFQCTATRRVRIGGG